MSGPRAAVTAGVVGVCGVVSLFFTLQAGKRNPSVLLIGMFMVWVAAPFVGMLWAVRRWNGLAVPAIILSATSVAVYAAVALHPVGKIAFPFLMTPAASSLVLGVAAVTLSRR